jgi:sialidase-1
MNTLTRRQALLSTTLGIGILLGRSRRAPAALQAKVEGIKVISKQPHLYHGWPTLTRRRNGQLVLVWSGGRQAHVCPFGRVEMMTSNDDGKNWTWPRVLLDSAIDDRDAGVLETARGTLLVTTFSSLAFEPVLKAAEGKKPGQAGAWPPERLAAWKAARDRLTPEQRRRELGVWMLRSEDGGITWSARYPCQVNSPHGPVALTDGRVLYAGKELWARERVGVCVSSDDGKTWKWLAEIPTRPGDNPHNYHELHAVDTGKGSLIVHIRNHNKANAGETLQSESPDGGKTWLVPHPLKLQGGGEGVWGLPSHLLRLRDGRLLMSYGYRRKPFGNQARLSEDGGKTWSSPLTISEDGLGGDLGYPSTVELADGLFLTVWYESMREPRGRAVLRQAHWRL